MKAPAPEEIEAAKSPRGGWTRDTLASWGVPWPPPKGWKKDLIRAHAKQKSSALAKAYADNLNEIRERTGRPEA